MAQKFTGDAGAALTAWIVFMFTAPHLFYANLLYPEVPTTLILALCLNALLFGEEEMSRRAALGIGLGIAVLPWFGVKFVIMSLALFLPIAFLKFGEFKRDPNKTALFLAGPVISGTLFIAYFLILYGNLSPISVYRGIERGGDGRTRSLSRQWRT